MIGNAGHAVSTRAGSIRAALALAAIACSTLWVYWGSLHAPFHFDDSLFLESPQVTDPGDPAFLIKPAQTRPLSYLTFYWNYRFGGRNAEGYHLVNLLLHLINVVLMYLFTRLLFEGRPEATGFAGRAIPIASAGVFALHPIQSEAVNYIYQRSVLLAAFLSLLALIFFLRSYSSPRRALLRLLSVLCWLLAAACKETAWILPMAFVAYIWTVAREPKSGFHSAPRSRWFVYACSALMLSGGGWVYYNLRQSGDRTIGSLVSHESLHYLIYQVQILAAYLRLLIWPSGLSIDHDPQLRPFWSSYGISCLLLLVVLLALIVRARKRAPIQAFLGLAFLLLLAPTSSIVPSADMLFEHRLYLPMISASALIGWGIVSLCYLINWPERARRFLCVGVLGALLAVSAVLTLQRNYVWGDDVRLWTDAVSKAPRKARPHYNLGVAYLSVNPELARREFLKVIELSPGHAAALYNLGWIDQSLGRYDSARQYYLQTLKVDAMTWRAHQNLGNLDAIQGMPADAAAEYRETIRLEPDYWPAYQSLATLQLELKNPGEALAILAKLKELRPDQLEASFLTAYALVESKQYPKAESELLSIEARDADGRYRTRIEELRRFMTLNGVVDTDSH